MKILISSIITLCIGLTIGYILNPQEKEVKIEIKEEIIQKPIKEENSLAIKKETKVLPKYIQNDLKEYAISPKNFTEEKWSEFLKNFEKGNFEELNSLSKEGSVIHLAAKNNSKELILKLLSMGYDINEKDINGMTPLLYAINKDTKVDFIEFLVDNGAKLTPEKEKIQIDALNLALGTGQNKKDDTNESLVEYLLENGFTLNTKYFDNILRIQSDKKQDYQRIFIDQLEVNEIIPLSSEVSYFQMMIGRLDEELLNYTLENKIDLDNLENKENLFINLFRKKNLSIEFIEKIMEKTKFDVNTKSKRGVTALMRATREGNIEKIKYLLENNAKLEDKDDRNRDVYIYLESAFGLSNKKKIEIKELFDNYKKKERNE